LRPLLLLFPLLCVAAAPPSYTLSADDLAKLAKGQVVVRHQDSATGGGVVAFVDVAAPPSVVLDEAMDLQDRVAENSSITALDVYRRVASPEEVGAQWTLSVMGSRIVFSILYSCQRDQGYCTYALDPSRPSDLLAAEGHYVVLPQGAGTRLVYASRTDSGRSMPGFVRRWIAGNSLHSQVEGIRDRAEAR
jgi:hypothetical protein